MDRAPTITDTYINARLIFILRRAPQSRWPEYKTELLNEITNIIQENIDYDPTRYSCIASTILKSIYLGINHKLELLHSLSNLGIIPHIIYYDILADAAYRRYYNIFYLLNKAGIPILASNISWLCHDIYLPVLKELNSLVVWSPVNCRRLLYQSIKYKSWTIVEWMINWTNAPKFNMFEHSRYDIRLELFGCDVNMYKKYYPQIEKTFQIKPQQSLTPFLYMCIYAKEDRLFVEAVNAAFEEWSTNILKCNMLKLLIILKQEKFFEGLILHTYNICTAIKYSIRAQWLTGIKLFTSMSILEDWMLKQYLQMSYKITDPDMMIIHRYIREITPITPYTQWSSHRHARTPH